MASLLGLGGSGSSSTDSSGAPAPALNNISNSDKVSNPTGASTNQNIGGGGSGGAASAPAPAGPTTAAPSGAAAQTGAPGSASAQAGASAPVSFSQWLGANQQGAQNQTSALTNQAASTDSSIAGAQSSFTGYTGSAVANAPGAVALSGSSASDINAASLSPSQYSGPTASSLSGSSQYGQLANAQGKSAQTAQTLRNNGSQANGYDAAIAQATKTRAQVLGAQGQLANTNSTASQAAQGAFNQAGVAQSNFNNTVSSNLGQIGNIAAQGAATASTAQAATQSTASAASSELGTASTPAQLTADIYKNMQFLGSLGVSPTDINTLLEDVNNHSYPLSQAVAWLQQQIKGGSAAATGYSTGAAATENAANAALGNGATSAAATGYTSNTNDVTKQDAQNQAAISSASQTVANYLKIQPKYSGYKGGTEAQDIEMLTANNDYAPLDNSVGYLFNNGMSLPEVAASLGLQPGNSSYDMFMKHYSGYTTNLQNVYGGDTGANYASTGSSQLFGKV